MGGAATRVLPHAAGQEGRGQDDAMGDADARDAVPRPEHASAPVSDDLLLWALCMVRTRSFSVRVEADSKDAAAEPQSVPILVPLADTLNHGPDQSESATWYIDDESSALRVFAGPGGVKDGAQVRLTRGNTRSAASLFFVHGIVPLDADDRDDEGVIELPQPVPGDPFAPSISEVLKPMGIRYGSTIPLVGGDRAADDVLRILSAFRVILLGPENLAHWRSAARGEPVTLELELNALREVRFACEARLSGMAGGSAGDDEKEMEKLAAEAMPQDAGAVQVRRRALLALRYRAAEKHVYEVAHRLTEVIWDNVLTRGWVNYHSFLVEELTKLKERDGAKASAK